MGALRILWLVSRCRNEGTLPESEARSYPKSPQLGWSRSAGAGAGRALQHGHHGALQGGEAPGLYPPLGREMKPAQLSKKMVVFFYSRSWCKTLFLPFLQQHVLPTLPCGYHDAAHERLISSLAPLPRTRLLPADVCVQARALLGCSRGAMSKQ